MKHQDARSLSPTAQEALRKRAVQAVLDGNTMVQVARIWQVSRYAVSLWVSAYRNGGLRTLNARRRGHPGHIRLKPWQAALTARLIRDKLPDQLKLPFVLWTREAVAQLIADRFGIQLSLVTVGRYLKRWGFTPQKPARRAYEQNPENLQRWLAEEYPTIRRQATQERAAIYWGDEMGVRSDHQAGRSYGLKGRTPVAPFPGKRFSCNVLSAISGRGSLRFMVVKEQFTSKVFLTFLKRLVKSSPQKVYLIVDQHPVHRSKRVQKWLSGNADDLRLCFLPPYSPELNPDEYLNNDVKSNAGGGSRAKSSVEMAANLRSYLRDTQRMPYLVKRYFMAPSVRYAADF
jgi:transposase